MKKVFKLTGLMIAGLLLFGSCNMDDGYSLDKFWIGYATVDGDQDNFRLVLNNETVMYIRNTVSFPEGYELEDGQRVIANFTILDDEVVNGQLYYHIRLNGMDKVLTKEPVYSSETTEDEIGNDPIDLYEWWFGGKYLNATFYFYANDPQTKHFINLWVDQENPDANEDNVYVELRHNAYGDQPYDRAFGRVSFDISKFIPEGKNSVTVHFKYTNYSGQVITKSDVFTRRNIDSGSQALSMSGKNGNII